MTQNNIKEKKDYLPPSMEVVSLREQIPLIAYSGAEFNLNESEKKIFRLIYQGPVSVPFFYLCGHGFNSEENRQALV